MLVFSRLVDEMIVIGGNIRVTIVDISGDNVKIGVDADRSISINRLEVESAKLKDGTSIVDWFNPQDITHLEAWDYYQRNGKWPENLVTPKDIVYVGGWQQLIQAKMAKAYMEKMLR